MSRRTRLRLLLDTLWVVSCLSIASTVGGFIVAR
jgi:hypothetical protein